MNINITTIVILAVAIWLVICAIYDWRKREIPNLLTAIPMLIAILWTAVTGNISASLLSAMMFFVIELKRGPGMAISIIALVFTIVLSYYLYQFSMENILSIVIIFGVCMLLYFEKTGGSDAKILITLTLLFGSTAFMWAVFAGGIAGVIALCRKHKQIPYVIPIAVGTIAYFAVKLV